MGPSSVAPFTLCRLKIQKKKKKFVWTEVLVRCLDEGAESMHVNKVERQRRSPLFAEWQRVAPWQWATPWAPRCAAYSRSSGCSASPVWSGEPTVPTPSWTAPASADRSAGHTWPDRIILFTAAPTLFESTHFSLKMDLGPTPPAFVMYNTSSLSMIDDTGSKNRKIQECRESLPACLTNTHSVNAVVRGLTTQTQSFVALTRSERDGNENWSKNWSSCRQRWRRSLNSNCWKLKSFKVKWLDVWWGNVTLTSDLCLNFLSCDVKFFLLNQKSLRSLFFFCFFSRLNQSSSDSSLTLMPAGHFADDTKCNSS